MPAPWLFSYALRSKSIRADDSTTFSRMLLCWNRVSNKHKLCNRLLTAHLLSVEMSTEYELNHFISPEPYNRTAFDRNRGDWSIGLKYSGAGLRTQIGPMRCVVEASLLATRMKSGTLRISWKGLPSGHSKDMVVAASEPRDRNSESRFRGTLIEFTGICP